MFFKFKKPEPKTPAEEKLEKIAEMLFPPLRVALDKDGNKYHIDSSADVNLDAALTDLEEGHNDEASRKTIKSVADKLFELRQYLEVYRKFDKDAKYIMVEDLETKNVEKIEIRD